MAYGSILSAELDSAPSRKERGAFFTPPQVADFLADFAVKRKEDRVLEPAAGEAVFISAVASRLSGLGASGTDIRAQVEGYELHGASAAAARERLGNQGIDVGIHTRALPEGNAPLRGRTRFVRVCVWVPWPRPGRHSRFMRRNFCERGAGWRLCCLLSC